MEKIAIIILDVFYLQRFSQRSPAVWKHVLETSLLISKQQLYLIALFAVHKCVYAGFLAKRQLRETHLQFRCKKTDFTDCIISANFMNCNIKNVLLNMWYYCWQVTVDNDLCHIKKTVLPQNSYNRSNHREKVVLHCLHLGHTRASHDSLMASGDAYLLVFTQCHCQLAVHHVLVNCVLYLMVKFPLTCLFLLFKRSSDPLLVLTLYWFYMMCS